MSAQDDPTLREAIEAQLNERMFGTRTAMLCRVTAYKTTPRPLVSVQIAANKWERQGGQIVFTPEAELIDVPVMELAWGPFVIRGHIERGDHGVLLVCDRDIDVWLTQQGGDGEGRYNPALTLIHDINDALYLPAMQPNSVAGSPRTASRELVIGTRDGTTSIKLDAAETPSIEVNSTGPVEVNSPAVSLGNSNPVQGAHSIARVGVDYVVMGPPGALVPILPGTALPVPSPVPVPGPPSLHKVRG